jgi:hypothetical protein
MAEIRVALWGPRSGSMRVVLRSSGARGRRRKPVCPGTMRRGRPLCLPFSRPGIANLEIGNRRCQGGRVPVRSGPGPPKLLRGPRTVFPSLLPKIELCSGWEATGKQTMPGSVRQLPPPARTEPARWGGVSLRKAEKGPMIFPNRRGRPPCLPFPRPAFACRNRARHPRHSREGGNP